MYFCSQKDIFIWPVALHTHIFYIKFYLQLLKNIL